MASAALVITEAMSNSGHPGGAANGDWWELTNTGATSVDLTGYIWNDSADPTSDESIFPAVSIGAGESIVIVSEGASNLAGFIAAWGGGFTAISDDDFGGGNSFSGLGSGGDSIFLYTPAEVLVDSFTFGASTNGVSFERFTNGDANGLSVAGEFGAFVAINDGENDDPPGLGPGSDVGSPGIAVVPEPTAALATLTGLLAVAGYSRRRQ
ncbi:MAG: lamin tail domain-containing protein [Planctomycetota bacterium]